MKAALFFTCSFLWVFKTVFLRLDCAPQKLNCPQPPAHADADTSEYSMAARIAAAHPDRSSVQIAKTIQESPRCAGIGLPGSCIETVRRVLFFAAPEPAIFT